MAAGVRTSYPCYRPETCATRAEHRHCGCGLPLRQGEICRWCAYERGGRIPYEAEAVYFFTLLVVAPSQADEPRFQRVPIARPA